ncbi:DUF2225 domain-containing protein [Candidatus Poribacteria bacterium]|nr:DUF2225 domain-containing protein [Candidatus Poribacteria bacterium]
MTHHTPPDLLADIKEHLRAANRDDAVEADKAEVSDAKAEKWLQELQEERKQRRDFLTEILPKPHGPRLPVILWSRLYFDLEPYLIERSADSTSLLTFYHRQLGEVVAREYLAGDAKKHRHCSLAQYFGDQSLYLDKDGKKTPNIRKISELPWQLAQAREWERLCNLLADPLFFVESWDTNEFDVKAFWQQVETNSDFRMINAYKAELDKHKDDLVLLQRLSQLFQDSGHWKHAGECLQYRLEASRKLSNKQEEAVSLYSAGYNEYLQGKYKEACEFYQESRQMMEMLNDRKGLAKVLDRLGIIETSRSNYEKAKNLYAEALRLVEDANDRKMISRIQHKLAKVQLEQGRYPGALRLYQQLLEGLSQREDAFFIASVKMEIGRIYFYQGHYEDARRYYEESLEISERVGDKNHIATAWHNLGDVFYKHRDYEQARNYYDKAIEKFNELPNPNGIAHTLAQIGNTYYMEGHERKQRCFYDKARGYYNKALEIFEKLGHKGEITRVYNLFGSIHLDIGRLDYNSQSDYKEADKWYKKSLALSEKLNNRRTSAITLRNLGTLRTYQGKYAEAHELFRQSLEISRSLPDWHGTASTLENQGFAYESVNNLPLAAQAYEESLKIYKMLELPKEVTRIRQKIREIQWYFRR